MKNRLPRKRLVRKSLNYGVLEPKQLMAADLGAVNLVINGDFSNVPTGVAGSLFDSADVEGWTAANASDGQQLALFGFQTDRGTALKLDSSADQVDAVFQDIATEPGDDFLISFELRGQVPDGTTIIESVEVLWDGEVVGTFESTSQWQTHTITVEGGAGDTSRLEFREVGTADDPDGDGLGVLIDNVNVVSVLEQNVTNGSFETVTGAGPFFNNGEVEGFSALVRANTPALIQVQENGQIDNAPDATDGIRLLNLDTTAEVVDHVFTDLGTVEGQRYFVTFDVRVDGAQDQNPDEIRVRWRTPDSAISTDQWVATIFGNDTWQTFGIQVDGLGDLSRLELREPGGAGGDGSGALIDNIQLFSIEGVINDLVVDANGDAAGTSSDVDLAQGSSSVLVTPDIELAHPSGSTLSGATVTISQTPAAGEDLLAADVGTTGIVSNFDPTTGTLTLSGEASVSDYQTVLQSLRYEPSVNNPTAGTRELSIVVTDDAIIGDDQSSTSVTASVNFVENTLAIAAIPDQVVEAGSPLWITFDVDNPANAELQITGDALDSSLVTPRFETGDSWRLRVSAPDVTTNGVNTPIDGEITFQLFESIFGETARATERIRTLTNQGFYDGLTFHRVASDFVIQGGDPEGDGTGGSDLEDFDDQFNTLLQHNREGLLSFAKSVDDTNNSQFFVTDTATRNLDFNHTIFGVVTSGDDVRQAIQDVDAPGQTPTETVTITEAEIFQDNGTVALLLVAPEGVTGSTTMTVEVRDANGNVSTQSFTVNVVEPTAIPGPGGRDLTDGDPFLSDIPDLTGFFGTSGTLQLEAQDVEGDDVRFLGAEDLQASINALGLDIDDSFDYSVDPTTGLVSYTIGSEADSPDQIEFIVGVVQESRADFGIATSTLDFQVVTLDLSSASTPIG